MPSEPEVEAFKQGWRAGIASLPQWEQQHAAAASLVIRLTQQEVKELRDTLDFALHRRESVLVWVDPIDAGFKVKVERPLAVWSPPMGSPA